MNHSTHQKPQKMEKQTPPYYMNARNNRWLYRRLSGRLCGQLWKSAFFYFALGFWAFVCILMYLKTMEVITFNFLKGVVAVLLLIPSLAILSGVVWFCKFKIYNSSSFKEIKIQKVEKELFRLKNLYRKMHTRKEGSVTKNILRKRLREASDLKKSILTDDVNPSILTEDDQKNFVDVLTDVNEEAMSDPHFRYMLVEK